MKGLKFFDNELKKTKRELKQIEKARDLANKAYGHYSDEEILAGKQIKDHEKYARAVKRLFKLQGVK